MNALSVIVLLTTVGCSLAEWNPKLGPTLTTAEKKIISLFGKCSTEADCGSSQCCAFGKICLSKLPVHSTCHFSDKHGCGCVSGSSCKETYTFTIFGKKFSLKQCVKDDEPVEPAELNDTPDDENERARRFFIRKCSSETVAEDCGKERCCLGGKYCSPLIPKYVPCNLKNSHKCPCAAGLECRETKTLKIPFIGVTLQLKQCMPIGESSDYEEVEMIEN